MHREGDHEYIKEQVQSTTSDRQLILRLLSYLRPYRSLLIIAVSCLFIAKIIEVVVPIFIGKLTGSILTDSQINRDLTSVLKGGLILLSLLFMSYLLDSSSVLLRSWIGQNGLYDLRKQIYNHIIHMPLSFFNKSTVGRLMTRTIHDVDQINQMFSDSVIPIIGNLFLFIGIFIGIVVLDWKIGLLVTTILPLVWWLSRRFRYFQRICYDRIRTVVSAMNTSMQEHLMGVSIIRNFGLQSRTKQEFNVINEDYCSAYLESVHHFSFFMAGIELIQNMALILVFVLLVNFAAPESPFNIGMYLTFSLYSLMFFRPLADLAERYNVLQSAMAAAGRIFHVLDAESEQGVDKGIRELHEIQTITFENVWFSYEAEQWVLKGFSLKIKEGESYAFVGPTGEGKSTIMSLLLRFYEPQKGNILINEIPIQEYSLSSLRQQFSLVLQDSVVFSGTIADNLSLFDPSISRESIEKTIDFLGLRAWIARFSLGLDDYLYEQGKGLSAGEMQLISLARAVILRRSVLILDEATAHVDALTEKIMQQALHTVLHSKVTGQTRSWRALVIAHRLSTIKDVANIVVLQGGKVAEIGTHQALLEKKGIYEKLYRLQFVS
jgi:ATP-binding cassette, subfamily B, multidrug efflux pump